MKKQFAIIIASCALSTYCSGSLFIDFTEESVPTGTGSQVTVTIFGSINTAAFSNVVTEDTGGQGIDGNVFISSSLVQFGNRPFFPGAVRLGAQSSTVNWYPGNLLNMPSGISFGDAGFQLERNLTGGIMTLAVADGVSGVLAYPGPMTTLLANTSLASLGVTPVEATAGPSISTASSNGITETLTVTFNAGGIPEPSSAVLLLSTLSLMFVRRR